VTAKREPPDYKLRQPFQGDRAHRAQVWPIPLTTLLQTDGEQQQQQQEELVQGVVTITHLLYLIFLSEYIEQNSISNQL